MIFKFSDSHCHLDYFSQPEIIINEAKKVGLNKIIALTVAAEDFQKNQELKRFPEVKLAFGLHPLYQSQHQKNDLQNLEKFLAENQVVAIGEVGLDFRPELSAFYQQQLEFFRAQIVIAKSAKLPLLIHNFRALDTILAELKKANFHNFIIHSFSGSDVQLAKLLDLGGIIGIGGTITYPRAQRLRRQVANLAPNLYLLESDAPTQNPKGWQGQDNQPQFIKYIAEELAFLRNETLQKISQDSENNFSQFFNLS